ncbi:hypothetical protein [Cedecea davisae]|uniref:hypothetical protein n=1 Tax=Cedecea davisae TaxID=158484 RepID=UPI0024329F16|nr:hypothetical protein [Cedecea davisae]
MNDTNDIFNAEFSRQYDVSNQRLKEVSDNLHLLISLLLRDFPADSRVLCVGVGTGTEIVRLAKEHPTWRFACWWRILSSTHGAAEFTSTLLTG